MQSFKIFSRN